MNIKIPSTTMPAPNVVYFLLLNNLFILETKNHVVIVYTPFYILMNWSANI